MTSSSLAPACVTEPATTRWQGVGHSIDSDARVATEAAFARALSGRHATLLILLCSPRLDLSVVAETARGLLPEGAQLVGGTTNGQLSPLLTNESVDPDQGVVVVAFGGDGFETAIGVEGHVSADRRSAGQAVASVMAELTLPHQVCLMFCDGLTRGQHEVVRGGFSALGALVPIVGGCTGDNLTYTKTFQFFGDRSAVAVHSDAVVAVGLASTAPLGVGIAHGWHKVDEPMLVTSSSGGRVYELDNKPALPLYLERLGHGKELLDDPMLFRDTAFLMPLGLSRRSSEDIRVVHAGDVSDNSIDCLADVPQGALVWTMTATRESLITAARDSTRDALAGLEGHPAAGVLLFDCGARKVMLERSGITAEVSAIAETVDVPFGGFYTFGELARVRGSRGMHHLTVVSLALGS